MSQKYKCPKCEREFKIEHWVKNKSNNNFNNSMNHCSGIMKANFQRHLNKCGVVGSPFKFITP